MMHGDAIDTHSLLFWFCGMIVEEVEVVGELFFMVKETKRKIKLKKTKEGNEGRWGRWSSVGTRQEFSRL